MNQSRTDRRKSYSETARVRGDRSRRVAVPIPGRLRDLENQATRYFGLDRSTVQLHHRGDMQLQADEQLKVIKAGDVIVAKGARPHGPEFSTTHQRDYVAYKFEPAPRVTPRQLPKSLSFTGRSHYHENYPPHEITMPPRPTPRTPARSAPFEGNSTYLSHYPGHRIERTPPPPPRKAKPALPFEGTSTYAEAYHAHKVESQGPMPARTQHPQLPFEGSSTYHSHYPGHAIERTPPPKPRTPKPTLPFQGSSEYQQSYVEKGIEVPRYIYIEPALSDVA